RSGDERTLCGGLRGASGRKRTARERTVCIAGRRAFSQAIAAPCSDHAVFGAPAQPVRAALRTAGQDAAAGGCAAEGRLRANDRRAILSLRASAAFRGSHRALPWLASGSTGKRFSAATCT